MNRNLTEDLYQMNSPDEIVATTTIITSTHVKRNSILKLKASTNLRIVAEETLTYNLLRTDRHTRVRNRIILTPSEQGYK